MRIYLIRHTTPDVPSGMCYGHADVPLVSGAGSEMAAIADKLKDLPPLDSVYTSPSLRCAMLSEELRQRLSCGGPVVADQRLRELHFGEWEMQLWDALPRAEIAHWSDDFVHRAPPGGESFAALHERVGGFLDELLAAEDESSVAVVVTHSGVIRSVWSRLLDIPLTNMFRLSIDYGAMYCVELQASPDYCSIRVL